MDVALNRGKAVFRLYRRKLKLNAQYLKNTKPAFFWSIIGISTLTGLITLVFLGTFLLVLAGLIGDVPGVNALKAIKNYEASQVLDTNGSTLGKYYIQNRLNADFEEINKSTINALISIEDSRFYEHSGIDYRSWFRVFFKSILLNNKSSGGGSTISQQLAKNLYPRESYAIFSILINKYREFIIARRIEKLYSKDQILKLYLNTVPFSENIFGIKVAAQRFYNKKPKELKVEEAATLIGTLKATSWLNPRKYPQRAFDRRNLVFEQMAKNGYLSPIQKDSLSQLAIQIKYSEEGHDEGLATHFRELVRQEAAVLLSRFKKPNGANYNLYTDGLQIHTTIDEGMQIHAENAIAWHMAHLQKQFDEHWNGRTPWKNNEVEKAALASLPLYESLMSSGKTSEEISSIIDAKRDFDFFSWDGRKEVKASIRDSIQYYNSLLNAGFIVMDTKGVIKSWVGGISYKDFKFDMITSQRQVGSTFKPVVYAAAMQNGYSPCDLIPNQLTIYTEYDDWKPENANNQYGGFYSVLGGIVGSVNTIAVQLIMESGIDKVIQLAKKLGVNSNIPEAPSIALGTANLSLLEMTGLYQSLSNKGHHIPPKFISKISDRNGNLVVNNEIESEGTSAFSDTISYLLTEMLQMAVDSGTGKRLITQFGLNNDMAGKTGTTQSHADGWFIGYTPTIVAGVRVGASSPEIHFRNLSLGQGSNMALPIFGKFMTLLKKDPNYSSLLSSSFENPPDTIQTMLECPLYLTDEEYIQYQDELDLQEILDDLLEPGDEKNEFRNLILDIFKKKKPSKESEKIRLRNERIKKRRKKEENKKGIIKRLFGNR